jgi:hypothetical protein
MKNKTIFRPVQDFYRQEPLIPIWNDHNRFGL